MHILEETILDESAQDKLTWISSVAGSYSCKSFKMMLQDRTLVVPIWKALLWIPTRLEVKTFMWLLIKH